MKRIKRLLAQAILLIVDEIRDEYKSSAEDYKEYAEAIKILSEAVKNLK